MGVIDYSLLSDRELAQHLIDAEARDVDSYESLYAMNEVLERLQLPADEVELGITPWASEQIDRWLARATR